MTLEEAYAEMKRRGWGFATNYATNMIAIGPVQNPDYEETGLPPLIEVLAIGLDRVETLERAIRKYDAAH